MTRCRTRRAPRAPCSSCRTAPLRAPPVWCTWRPRGTTATHAARTWACRWCSRRGARGRRRRAAREAHRPSRGAACIAPACTGAAVRPAQSPFKGHQPGRLFAHGAGEAADRSRLTWLARSLLAVPAMPAVQGIATLALESPYYGERKPHYQQVRGTTSRHLRPGPCVPSTPVAGLLPVAGPSDRGRPGTACCGAALPLPLLLQHRHLKRKAGGWRAGGRPPAAHPQPPPTCTHPPAPPPRRAPSCCMCRTCCCWGAPRSRRACCCCTGCARRGTSGWVRDSCRLTPTALRPGHHAAAAACLSAWRSFAHGPSHLRWRRVPGHAVAADSDAWARAAVRAVLSCPSRSGGLSRFPPPPAERPPACPTGPCLLQACAG